LGPLLYLREKTAVKQWKYAESLPPKKPKAVWSARKVMASVFWDAKGILLIDYPPSGQTNTGQYYVNRLDQIQEKIREKRARFGRERSHLARITPTCTQVLLPWQKSMN
jgi:Transposase.